MNVGVCAGDGTARSVMMMREREAAGGEEEEGYEEFHDYW